jgi:hypothetical protein
MLANKTVENQINLPEAVVGQFAGVDYFEVSTDGECIILRPLEKSPGDEVREHLAQLGITEEDIAAAVKWARATA